MSEEVKKAEVKAKATKTEAPKAEKTEKVEKITPKADTPAAAKNGEAPKRKFGTGSNFSSDNITANARSPRSRNDRSSGGRGGNRGRRGDRPVEDKTFEEVAIAIDRVSRSVKGGRRMRFKALVVVGDKKTRVGVGVAKGQDVQLAIQKATSVAKKNLIEIPITNTTIPHDIEIKHGGAQVLLKPAAPGTGIIAGGVVRSVIGVTGITNLLTKSLGSTNKVNIAYATVDALRSLVPRSEWVGAEKTSKPAKKTAKGDK